MALEELQEKIKETTAWKRYIVVFILAMIPAGYYINEKWTPLTTEKTEAEDALSQAKVTLEQTKGKVKELPELEKRLNIINENLAKAQNILPSKISADMLLHLVGSIAKQNEVDLETFVIEGETKSSSGDYYETPIKIAIRGSFRDVTSFYDHIVHSNKMIHIRDMDMTSMKQTDAKDAKNSTYLVKSNSRLVVFRGA